MLLSSANREIRLPTALPNREEGEPDRTTGARELGQVGVAKGRSEQRSLVADLARFFPDATPVRIPVQFTRRAAHGYVQDPTKTDGVPIDGQSFPQKTVIEYGTSREVLFACTTPMEFADIVRLRNSDGSLDTEASIVAVQYHPGETVVAARFLQAVPNWIVKP